MVLKIHELVEPLSILVKRLRYLNVNTEECLPRLVNFMPWTSLLSCNQRYKVNSYMFRAVVGIGTVCGHYGSQNSKVFS